jgi:hypothetical protein
MTNIGSYNEMHLRHDIDVVKPKAGERVEEYIARRRCRNCERKGAWRVLTEDEAQWD